MAQPRSAWFWPLFVLCALGLIETIHMAALWLGTGLRDPDVPWGMARTSDGALIPAAVILVLGLVPTAICVPLWLRQRHRLAGLARHTTLTHNPRILRTRDTMH